MPHYLLTSTTYGTWLPGDVRGFVSNVRAGPGPEVRHNSPGTPYDANLPNLRRSARANLIGKPIYLQQEHADLIAGQFRSTAAHRNLELLAFAVMCNHFHIVVGAHDVEPPNLLRDFKSYASRGLNRQFAKPCSGTWWTESGSRRTLPNENAVSRAVDYVRLQPNALVVWLARESRLAGPSGG